MAPSCSSFIFCPSSLGAAIKGKRERPGYMGSHCSSRSSSSFITVNLQTTHKVSLKMAFDSPQFDDDTSYDGYELRTTEHKGEGVYATRPFHPGEIVVKGFIVAEVSANHSHATQVALDRFVQHGGLNSKVNHSCSPNCGIRVNADGANDIVAMRPIQIGDELSFDYAMRNYRIEHFPKECMCGAAECRRTVTGYKDLPEKFRKKYEGFIAPYLLELGRQVQKKVVK